jgi:hypothetical protein
MPTALFINNNNYAKHTVRAWHLPLESPDFEFHLLEFLVGWLVLAAFSARCRCVVIVIVLYRDIRLVLQLSISITADSCGLSQFTRLLRVQVLI